MSKENKKRIGIDARLFGLQQKGLGRYVQKLIEHLEKEDQDNHYVVFLRKDNWSEYVPQNPNFEKALADYKWYGFQEQIFFPFKIWRKKINLMHFPHFNVPLLNFCPFIVTIHDLILRQFSTQRASTLGFLKYQFKNLAYRAIISQAVQKANWVIAVSRYTKNDILKSFPIKEDKVKVIYEGSPEVNFKSSKKKKIKQVNFKKPYLLYVGNAYPHKNLEKLITAFCEVASTQEGKNLNLVLVGKLDYFYQRLKRRILYLSPKIKQRIIFTGFVPDEDLFLLYRHATLYVFPSLYEGFGLPPLEAMACDCPVLSSRSTCLPEVLGEAAIYFNPEKAIDLSQKIKQALANQGLRQDLIIKGRNQIKLYCWQKMARRTKALYM